MLTLIHSAAVLTMDEERRVLPRGAIAIADDRVYAVGPEDEISAQLPAADCRIDARGMVALPGFVNAHTHMAQSLQRGLSDDLELLSFLKELAYPVSQTITPHHVGVGALLSCAEALRSGTTCLVDNITGEIEEASIAATASALRRSGIRGLIAISLTERTPRCDRWHVPDYIYTRPLEEQLSLVERSVARWHGAGAGRILVCPAPVTTWAASARTFLEAHHLAEKHGLLLHTHVAESRSEVEACLEDHGQHEVEWLHSLGVLDAHFMVVHGVWLTDQEIALLSRSGASVVHCPTSNMYLASGVAPIPALLEAGVPVALGSDGIGNHNHDMFSVLKSASLLQKVVTRDPTVTSAEEVLEMATLGGARALGLDGEIGSLEVGKKADLVLVRLDSSHLIPVHRLASALVYGANGADVDMVMVDGRVLVRNGRVESLDEEHIILQAGVAAEDLACTAGLQRLRERAWGRKGGYRG